MFFIFPSTLFGWTFLAILLTIVYSGYVALKEHQRQEKLLQVEKEKGPRRRLVTEFRPPVRTMPEKLPAESMQENASHAADADLRSFKPPLSRPLTSAFGEMPVPSTTFNFRLQQPTLPQQYGLGEGGYSGTPSSSRFNPGFGHQQQQEIPNSGFMFNSPAFPVKRVSYREHVSMAALQAASAMPRHMMPRPPPRQPMQVEMSEDFVDEDHEMSRPAPSREGQGHSNKKRNLIVEESDTFNESRLAEPSPNVNMKKRRKFDPSLPDSGPSSSTAPRRVVPKGQRTQYRHSLPMTVKDVAKGKQVASRMPESNVSTPSMAAPRSSVKRKQFSPLDDDLDDEEDIASSLPLEEGWVTPSSYRQSKRRRQTISDLRSELSKSDKETKADGNAENTRQEPTPVVPVAPVPRVASVSTPGGRVKLGSTPMRDSKRIDSYLTKGAPTPLLRKPLSEEAVNDIINQHIENADGQIASSGKTKKTVTWGDSVSEGSKSAAAEAKDQAKGNDSPSVSNEKSPFELAKSSSPSSTSSLFTGFKDQSQQGKEAAAAPGVVSAPEKKASPLPKVDAGSSTPGFSFDKPLEQKSSEACGGSKQTQFAFGGPAKTQSPIAPATVAPALGGFTSPDVKGKASLVSQVAPPPAGSPFSFGASNAGPVDPKKPEAPASTLDKVNNTGALFQMPTSNSTAAGPAFAATASQPSSSVVANSATPTTISSTPATASVASSSKPAFSFGASTTPLPSTSAAPTSFLAANFGGSGTTPSFGGTPSGGFSFGASTSTTTTTTLTSTTASTSQPPAASNIVTPSLGAPVLTTSVASATPSFGGFSSFPSGAGSSILGVSNNKPGETKPPTAIPFTGFATNPPTAATSGTAGTSLQTNVTNPQQNQPSTAPTQGGFAFNLPTSSAPAFGSAATSTTTAVAPPRFGNAQSNAPFGAVSSTQTPAFGTQPSSAAPPFGASSATPSFGASNSIPTFGVQGQNTNAPAFGNNTVPNPMSSSSVSNTNQPAFGAASAAPQPFSMPASSGFSFGAPSSGTPGFGATPAPSFGGAFGQPATTNGINPPRFGQASGQTFGAQPSNVSGPPAFGPPTNQSTPAFGQPNQPSTTPAFGQPKPSTTHAFGQPNQPSNTPFGQTPTVPAFGSQPSGPSTPSFPFGQSSSTGPSASQGGGASTGFKFGGGMPTGGAAPSFAFGGGAPAPSTGFAFGGGNMGQPAAGQQQPGAAPGGFNFGAPPSGSQFVFGQGSPAASAGVPSAGGMFNIGAENKMDRKLAQPKTRMQRRPGINPPKR
ncbi:hypothetical protein HDU76_011959 [Blyttiomyces sp. JEL0837]|nr:hypothetical protein HDU76_011959 [Blyttiomyces sp. JEL0837]